MSLILCDWLVPSFTTILHNSLLGCISLLWEMRHIVADWVAWCVCLSVGWSVAIMSPAKTTEPIEMLIGWTRVGPRYHVLDEGSRSPHAKGKLWWKKLSAREMAGWSTILQQQHLSFREMLDQVHYSCRRLCWKVTKYGLHVLWLTVSDYELSECPHKSLMVSVRPSHKICSHTHHIMHQPNCHFPRETDLARCRLDFLPLLVLNQCILSGQTKIFSHPL